MTGADLTMVAHSLGVSPLVVENVYRLMMATGVRTDYAIRTRLPGGVPMSETRRIARAILRHVGVPEEAPSVQEAELTQEDYMKLADQWLSAASKWAFLDRVPGQWPCSTPSPLVGDVRIVAYPQRVQAAEVRWIGDNLVLSNSFTVNPTVLVPIDGRTGCTLVGSGSLLFRASGRGGEGSPVPEFILEEARTGQSRREFRSAAPNELLLPTPRCLLEAQKGKTAHPVAINWTEATRGVFNGSLISCCLGETQAARLGFIRGWHKYIGPLYSSATLELQSGATLVYPGLPEEYINRILPLVEAAASCDDRDVAVALLTKAPMALRLHSGEWQYWARRVTTDGLPEFQPLSSVDAEPNWSDRTTVLLPEKATPPRPNNRRTDVGGNFGTLRPCTEADFEADDLDPEYGTFHHVCNIGQNFNLLPEEMEICLTCGIAQCRHCDLACDDCGTRLCHNCTPACTHCEVSLCGECRDGHGMCAACGNDHFTCEQCNEACHYDDGGSCDRCDQRVCNECAGGFQTCCECEATLCEGCTYWDDHDRAYCSSHWEEYCFTCAGCSTQGHYECDRGWSCSSCEQVYCDHCDDVGWECPQCGEHYCDDCGDPVEVGEAGVGVPILVCRECEADYRHAQTHRDVPGQQHLPLSDAREQVSTHCGTTEVGFLQAMGRLNQVSEEGGAE